jgi:hypothetical protein
MDASPHLMAPTQEEEFKGDKRLASPQTRNSGLIPLVLDIERGKGKRDLDGAGMASVIRVCRDQHE